MRGAGRAANEDLMRSANHAHHALETITAAATAIASAENRASQASVQKRRWRCCFSIYWCFGMKKQNKRIGHAVFDPETRRVPGEGGLPLPDNPTQTTTTFSLPFVAPPSSPVSFLHSEPPSAIQSPGGMISFSSMSANMLLYSPGGPASMFSMGPYAHEPQLVSPPVFSTFTTEPSTAPFTPPPELVHLTTTPSSPEVPFAKLLDPNFQNSNMFPLSPREFHSYQLQPGSPISRLLSPASAISGSGTSSPFPDRELFYSLGPSCHDVTPLRSSYNNSRRNGQAALNHRVSFEASTEDSLRCMEKMSRILSEAGLLVSIENGQEKESNTKLTVKSPGEGVERGSGDGNDEKRDEMNPSMTVEEFNFDNVNEETVAETLSVVGWENEKGIGEGGVGPCPQNWSFFPMMMQHYSSQGKS
ncbi:unnamed protein product [Cuscuta europaea]|uniref:Uncharacterized protein n=2 Tax=Cuscuta europaea TaxID=41803 RepID=A0A9P0YN78_CUSEU|nr:unnamed protein product [Cuscuta europaea]